MILFAYGHQSLQVIHYVILWIILSRIAVQRASFSGWRDFQPPLPARRETEGYGGSSVGAAMSWCHFRKRDSSDAVPRSSRFPAKAVRPMRREPYRSHRQERNRSRLRAILHCPYPSRSCFESELRATQCCPEFSG